MDALAEFLRAPRVAYFSMEMALQPPMRTYAGGLGVLAGDVMHTAADLGLPMVGVTLASHQGYFRQALGPSGQTAHPDPWQVEEFALRLGAAVALRLEGRDVWLHGWLYRVEGKSGGRAPVILLDTDVPANDPRDRKITDRLYGGDDVDRIKQEMVLGVGGVRLLRALGFAVRRYHLNEGHSAFIAAELMRAHAYDDAERERTGLACDLEQVRDACIFTTHTPIDAAQDRFSYEMFTRIAGDDVHLPTLKRLAGADELNMTRLALRTSAYVNGVAERHAQTARGRWEGVAVHAITNGVHPRWAGPAMSALYDRYIPKWRLEPELLVRADVIASDELHAAHAQEKSRLIDRVHAITGVRLDASTMLIGAARRMTAYKRPTLLFSDLRRVASIARARPFAVLVAGKAHPRDVGGQRLIAELLGIAGELGAVPRVLVLPDYEMTLAAQMVAGCDIWLNTPLPPLEASGTSGIKAALNAVPSLSVLDGWWIEGCIEGVTGWAIGDPNAPAAGDEAESLYAKLERVVLPLFYDDRDGWARIMAQAVSKNASYFSSHRMMRRYVTEAYFR